MGPKNPGSPTPIVSPDEGLLGYGKSTGKIASSADKIPRKKNMSGYHSYIHKLSKKVYKESPHHISSKAMSVLNAICVDLNARINRQANAIIESSKTATRSELVLLSSLKLVFGTGDGDLHKYVLIAVLKALAEYKKTLPTKKLKKATKKNKKSQSPTNRVGGYPEGL